MTIYNAFHNLVMRDDGVGPVAECESDGMAQLIASKLNEAAPPLDDTGGVLRAALEAVRDHFSHVPFWSDRETSVMNKVDAALSTPALSPARGAAERDLLQSALYFAENENQFNREVLEEAARVYAAKETDRLVGRGMKIVQKILDEQDAAAGPAPETGGER